MLSEIPDSILKKYEIEKLIGRGAYGSVWKAIDRKTNTIVALKLILNVFGSLSNSQLHLSKILIQQELLNHNVLSIYDVIRKGLDLYIALEFMESDLEIVIHANILEPMHIKYITYQLLSGLIPIHRKGIALFTLRPRNILINSETTIKFSEFSNARSLNLCSPASNYLENSWYKAPEGLLQIDHNGTALDMWIVGCIIAEMFMGKPIFLGSSYLDQLRKIIEVIGMPSLAFFEKLPNSQKEHLNSVSGLKQKDLLKVLGDKAGEAVGLISQLLQFDPELRITAEKALQSSYLEEIHTQMPPLNQFSAFSNPSATVKFNPSIIFNTPPESLYDKILSNQVNLRHSFLISQQYYK